MIMGGGEPEQGNSNVINMGVWGGVIWRRSLGRGEGISFWADQSALPLLGNRYNSDSIMAIFILPR